MRAIVTAVVLAALSAGCAPKLNVEKPFALPSGTDHDARFDLPSQSVDQQVKVEVTSDQPVDVYVFLKEGDADPRELPEADRLKKAVASKKGVTRETLTASIPKGKEYLVLVHQPKTSLVTKGKVKFTN